MRSPVVRVSRKIMRALKTIVIPSMALLLALLPVVVVSMAMPMPVSAATDAAIKQRGGATMGVTDNTDLTIDKPVGVVAGDVMIVNIAKVGSTSALSPSGWTLIDESNLGAGRHGAVLYRVADGTEGASFTFALGTGTDGAVGSIVAFSGVDTSRATPFDAVGIISVQDTQTAVAPAITTVSDNTAVIMFAMAAASAPTFDDDAWSTTSPGALAEMYDHQYKGGGTNAASVGAAWAVKASTGYTGTGTAKLSSSERNGGILIALKPLKPSALTVAPATGTYGGTVSLTATLSPAVSGKTISFALDGVPAGTAVTDSTGVANITAVGLSGIDAGTYPTGLGANFAGDAGFIASSDTASLTVEARNIEVTADGTGKVYGDADPSLAYQISSGSLASGDSFSGKLARTAGEDVGTYAIQQGTLALSSNYHLTFTDGLFTIRLRDIEVTADDSSKVCGDADPSLTYHISSGSLASGDAFSGELVREAGEDIGTYAIQQGTLALSGNYKLTFVEGTFAINISDSGTSIPTVAGISPQSGQPGDTFDVVIRGSGFTGATAVDFGPGVTVNSFEVKSSTRIVANITIDPAAELVDNNVVVATPLGEGQLQNAFGIDLSTGEPRARGLWLLIILVLLAIALGLLLFAWFKRRNKRVAPELVPIMIPSRPAGGTLEVAELAQAPAVVADSGQAVASALDQPSEATEEAVGLEQTPSATADQSPEEPEKTAGVLPASAAAASQPRRRTKKKGPASTQNRSRTPTKKRKKASG